MTLQIPSAAPAQAPWRRTDAPWPAIIDGQAYIACTDVLPEVFVAQIAQNLALRMGAQGLHLPQSQAFQLCLQYFNDPLCDALVAEMDAAGIGQTVLMAADFTFEIREARLTVAEVIERHRAVQLRHPERFHVMVGVDPRWGREGLDLFEKAIREYGFVGMKLYPPCGYAPGDPRLYPFYEICRAHRLPVSVHTGGTIAALDMGLSYPRLVEPAARSFPDVNFILSHASTCYSDECVMLCASRPNIFLDVSGFSTQPLERLSALLRAGINHKIAFGTDWPSCRAQGRQKQLVEGILQENGPISEMRDFEAGRFFAGTLAALLPGNRRDRTAHAG